MENGDINCNNNDLNVNYTQNRDDDQDNNNEMDFIIDEIANNIILMTILRIF